MSELLSRGINVNINHVSFIGSQGSNVTQSHENSIAGCFKNCDTSVMYIFNSDCLSLARTELKTRCSIVNHLWYRLFACRISVTSVLSLLWFSFSQFHYQIQLQLSLTDLHFILPQVAVQRLAAQVWGLFVEVEGKNFDRKLTNLLPIISDAIVPERFEGVNTETYLFVRKIVCILIVSILI